MCRHGNDYHEKEEFTYSSLETGDSSHRTGPCGEESWLIRRQKEQRKARTRASIAVSVGRKGRGRASRFGNE